MSLPCEGGCVCGAIRYRVTAEPLTLYACHCTECQRYSGGSHGLSMILLKTALELSRGRPATYTAKLSGDRQANGKFCGECATRLWGEPVRFPQILVLRPGTLDDTGWIEPVAHIWVRSKQPWWTLPADAVTFDTQPDDSMTLVELWRQRSRATS